MRLSRSLLMLILLLLGLFNQMPSMAADANPMIHQSGHTIVDGAGNLVELKGVNLEGWIQWEGVLFGISMFTSGSTIKERIRKLVGDESEQSFEQGIHDNFVTEEDIARISQLGYNSVRLPITAQILEDPERPFVYKKSGWDLIDRAVNWCEKYGVYAIIDLHSAPGGQSKLPTCERFKDTDLLWGSEQNKRRTVEMWRAIANRYSSRRIVAGYDLLNEPVLSDGSELVHLYKRIIDNIRSVDANHMVIIEGGKMASDFSMFDQPLCDNQMYSFHMYTWFGDDRRKRLAKYKLLADSQNVPLWVGEFGANTYQMIDTTTAMFNGMPEVAGWAYWTWKKAPSKYPGLATITLPADWTAVAKWISLPLGLKPSLAKANRGLDDLVRATKLENTSWDTRMQQMIMHTQAKLIP